MVSQHLKRLSPAVKQKLIIRAKSMLGPRTAMTIVVSNTALKLISKPLQPYGLSDGIWRRQQRTARTFGSALGYWVHDIRRGYGVKAELMDYLRTMRIWIRFIDWMSLVH
jgi:hypothetical protein